MQGELTLRSNGQAVVRTLLLAAVLAAPLGPLFVAALSASFGLGLFKPPEHGGLGEGPWVPMGLAFGGAAAMVCWAVVAMRQPKGAKLSIDDWGITEWDGDGIRTAIPFAAMKRDLHVTGMASQRGVANAVAGAVLAQGGLPSTPEGRPAIGGHLVLADDDGRRIDVTQGVQSIVLNDRLSTVDDLFPVMHLTEGKPPANVKRFPRSENVAALGLMLGIVAYLASAASLVGLITRAPEPWLPPLAALAGLLLLLRSLPWWVRARRGRDPSGLTKVELAGGEGLTVQLADGRKLEQPKHPDALIGTRRGEGWLSAAGVVETSGAREARLARRRGNLLAASLRTAMAGAMLVVAARPLTAFVTENTAGLDPRVTMLWKSRGDWASGKALAAEAGLALVLESDGFQLVDLRTGQARAMPFPCTYGDAALSPDGRYALLTCDKEEGTLFSLEGEPKALCTVKGNLMIESAAFGPGVVYLGSYGSELAQYEVPSCALRKKVDAEDGAGWLAVSADGSQVASISLYASAHKAWLWDAAALTARRLYDDGDGEALAFSPDGSPLALAMYSEVKLVDVAKHESIATIPLGRDRPSGVAFSPDGRTLAIATGEALAFWDVATRAKKSEVPLRWKRGVFGQEHDAAGALAWSDESTVVFLAKGRGVALEVRAP